MSNRTLLSSFIATWVAVANGAFAADPAHANVRRIEITPPTIEFRGPYEAIQLRVTGERADGSVVDLTRDAVVRAENGAENVVLDARARVRPQRDGNAELVVEVGGVSARVPISIDGVAANREPHFRRDVEPVLTRLGCNMGTCHGSAKGKNGFKLSLRGYDPEFDHLALTDDLAGRRFDPVAPERSLFLLKPTGVVPHEGGARLTADSPEYSLLRAWVEFGARDHGPTARVANIALEPADAALEGPGATQQMVVVANYTDGSRRDVTALAFVESDDPEIAKVDADARVTGVRRGEVAILARFEGAYAALRVPVGAGSDAPPFEWRAAPQYGFIDEMIDAKLRRLHANPAPLASDAEFIRRLHLDLTGLPPTLKQTTTFLDDTRDSRVKREELIDRLIGSPEYVDHWTAKWADLLQVNSKFLGPDGAAALHAWIRRAVASDLPWDRFVREVLGGSGSTLTNPPAAYYKVLRAPDVVMENTTQLALGIRFNCNKCHDHPFERWTRAQHWQLASYFARVTRENAPGSPLMPAKGDNQPDDVPVAYEERIGDAADGELKDPDTGVIVPPAFPYAVPSVGGGEPAATRRAALVDWITASDNPYFATSYVNRVWSYLTGTGFIEPIDDIRATNPPTHPELLERLTREFVGRGLSTRWLLREICRSRVYQQSVLTDETNASDTRNYSHATARRLPAEVLYDAVHVATGATSRLPGSRPGTRAAELVDSANDSGDGFLALFGRPPRESVCECERKTGLSLGQALNLVNGETVATAVRDPNNAIAALVASERDAGKIVDELFLSFLSRHATESEIATFGAALDPRRAATADALAPDDAKELARRRAEFEATLRPTDWRVARFVSGRSDAGATFTARDDGSILVGGAQRDDDTYTLTFAIDEPRITGIRLEAVADPTLPGGGPGRAPNGNFVLGEVRAVAVAPAGASRVLTLGNATADFEQSGFPAGNASDGNATTGWAVVPNTGSTHTLVLEAQDDGPGGVGSTLVLSLEHRFGGGHSLGALRVAVTAADRPVRHLALPSPVIEALRLSPAERPAEAEDALHAFYLERDAEMVERLRLAAAQDLAWALVNSKAFLFNR